MEPLALANLVAKAESVHVRHEDVRDDAVHGFARKDLQRLDAIGGFERGVAFGFQPGAKKLPVRGNVVNDEKVHKLFAKLPLNDIARATEFFHGAA